MIEIQGKYGSARVFADALEPTAAEQLRTLCDQRFVEGCRLRIMPDVHAGAGCVIGFTADLGELVIPNIVGVDIGCGMLTVELGKHPIDYDALDALIRAKIPSGRGVHEGRELRFDELQALLEPEVPRERSRWGSDVDGWHYRLDELRSFITNNDYANYSANKLCSMLGASAEQKMQYFGIG